MRAMRSILAVATTALLIGSGTVPTNALPRTGAFDGEWSVLVQPLQSDCGGAFRYSIRIAGGRVYSPDPNYQASGVVASNGAIKVVVSQGEQSARGSGRLRRDTGAGRWQTAGGGCFGQWAAERRTM
jgi:hypothetical protein